MLRTLQFISVSASMVLGVFSIEAFSPTCPDESNQELVNEELQCPMELQYRETLINISNWNIHRNSDRQLYAYAPEGAVHHILRCDADPTVAVNDTMHRVIFSLEYVGDFVAAVNVVPNGTEGFYKMDAGGCQAYIFARKEQWTQKCPDNPEKYIMYSRQYKYISDRVVPSAVRTILRNVTLSSIKEEICARVNEDLRTVRSDLTEESSQLALTLNINDAIDKSLTDFRMYIKDHRVERTTLKQIHLPIYVMYGNFSGYIFTGGTFEDLSTVERVGDARVTIQPNAYNITSMYIFRQARVHFDSYSYHSETVPFNGTLSLIMRDLRFQVGRSGFHYRRMCNESIWFNLTRIGGITYQFSDLQRNQSMMYDLSDRISPKQHTITKEILGLPIVWNLFQYAAADYSNYIYAPCMSNSSKAWRHIYTSQTNYLFI